MIRFDYVDEVVKYRYWFYAENTFLMRIKWQAYPKP